MKHILLLSNILILTALTAHAQTRFNYAQQWRSVDQLMEGVLPQSALPQIELIRQAAIRDNEYGHLIKSVITRNTCLQMTDEKPLIAVINSLHADAEALPFPARAVIYSLLGEFYLNFYNQNRWTLYQRTAVAEEAQTDDVETWDATRLIREVARYYTLSLSEPTLLQNTPIERFKEALEENADARYLRPTLYDLLAHRAIDAWINNDLRINDFSQTPLIDAPAAFGDAKSFVSMDITTNNPLATTYFIMKLFQDLTKFRLAQNDINALTDVNLKRFKYVRDNGNFDDVDNIYEQALRMSLTASAGNKIWGKVAYTLAIHYRMRGENATDRRNNYLVEAVRISREIEKNAFFEKDRNMASELLKELTHPQARISTEKNLIPNQPALALITYKNLTTAYINVYRYNLDEFNDFMRSMNSGEDLPRFLIRQELVAQQTLNMPLQTDFRLHSFETQINGLPNGNYLIVLSEKQNPAREKSDVLIFNPVQVTSIKLLQRSHGDGNTEAYVVDAISGKPVNNAHVTVIEQSYDNQQSRFINTVRDTALTNVDGTAFFTVPISRWNKKFKVVYEDDELIEDFKGGRYGGEQRKIPRTVFFTDRAIYRPGQTVYFKGLMYETDNKGHNAIKAGANTTVRVLDRNGSEVYKHDFTSNEFGTFSGFFVIPQGVLTGRMFIRDENANWGFSVEEYKRPTFEIKMNPIMRDYALGDTVTITGIAQALAGYPIGEAKVAYRIVRHQQWRPLRGNWRMFPQQRRNSRNIAAGTINTDNRGVFNITFLAAAEDIRLNDNNIYRYELTIDVTDINGETQSITQNVRISRLPLTLDFRLPENILADDIQPYPLRVANLNDNDVSALVQIEIWRLDSPTRLLRDRLWQQPDTFVMQRSEFASVFPHDPHFDEMQPERWAKTERVAAFEINTPQTAQIDLSMLRDAPAGWYFVKLQATGGQRNVTISDSSYFRLQRSDAEIMHLNEWLTVIKSAGEPDEEAVFRVAGGRDSTIVRYEILSGNNVIERKNMIVGRKPQELRIPITEAYRGGFAVAFAMVQNNREYTVLQEITVPYTNKQLDIAFTTFRDRLLPGENEKWTLTVKNIQGEREAAEMAATLYDASLEQFAQHGWMRNFYNPRPHGHFAWNQRIAPLAMSRSFNMHNFVTAWEYQMLYERFSQIVWGNMRIRAMAAVGGVQEEEEVILFSIIDDGAATTTARNTAAAAPQMVAGDFAYAEARDEADVDVSESERETAAHAAIALRTNFSETAFFYPHLRTNEQGEILIEFAIPEALTRWNMLGFAHTKDFKVGNVQNSLITQKQVAISANLPRFFRTGDTLTLSAKVNNLTENELNGNALLRFYDAFTMQPVDAQILQTAGTQRFAVKAGESVALQWKLAIPDGLQAVTYRLTAQAGNHTDGEERSVPVLSNRTLVTETMPFMVRGDERRDFRFERLAESATLSPTLSHHRLTLEYTSNPVWYAVQALPYLMESVHENSERLFSRFYANTLATAAANSSPRVKQVFELWQSLPDSRSLVSNLEKNHELKQALLEETPWVAQAANETEMKKRIGLLFDLNRMANEQREALQRLQAIQGANGGFPWFTGMPEDRFMTQHIVAGLEYLRRLNALSRNDDVNTMIERALAYCDARISDDYKRRDEARTVPLPADHLLINRLQLHYLYACSFSRHYAADQEAFNYYLQQAERSWARFNLYEQAMIALVMHRYGRTSVAHDILRSLKERAQTSDELGMYWADNRRGFFWHQSPVETQVMLISAFNEAGNDTRAVAEMKIWLLRNKQTTNWKTSKATVEAIYALMSTEDDDLFGDANQQLDIRIGGRPLRSQVREPLRPEAGSGYVKTSWSGRDINLNFADLRVTNPNPNIAWGAMYWQYFEDIDKVESAETNLQITRRMFIKRITPAGAVLEPITSGNRPRVGDIVTVRMELRADRNFEYVHLKDTRPSGFEPVNVISGYRFRDGLGYYESIRDASVNFFIDYLRPGTYVLEYDLRVANAGNFASGIATFQSMYAPEFGAHSGGGRISVSE